MNIVLTGPSGAGKTAAGRMAAEMLGMGFADTDAMVEAMAGSAPHEIIMQKGEETFRESEAVVVARVAALDNHVIATGGGVVLRPGNMRALRMNGVIINLMASARTMAERLGGMSERPLLACGPEAYLAARGECYANADFRIDTDGLDIAGVADRVAAIYGLPVIRICACVSGHEPGKLIRHAVLGGASMVELRLDLMEGCDLARLIADCPLPVIATDRVNSDNLMAAVEAGCQFIDVDIDCSRREDMFRLARDAGCRTIISLHDGNGVPDVLPGKGDADLLKIAATINCPGDMRKLVALHGQRSDVIIAGMGPLGGLVRVFGPMLGSHLTYCHLGEPTATGQLDLRTMVEIYRGMKLR